MSSWTSVKDKPNPGESPNFAVDIIIEARTWVSGRLYRKIRHREIDASWSWIVETTDLAWHANGYLAEWSNEDGQVKVENVVTHWRLVKDDFPEDETNETN